MQTIVAPGDPGFKVSQACLHLDVECLGRARNLWDLQKGSRSHKSPVGGKGHKGGGKGGKGGKSQLPAKRTKPQWYPQAGYKKQRW